MIAKKKILIGIFAIATVIAVGWWILSYPTEVVFSNSTEERAIEIAEKNETVKQYIEQGYEISDVYEISYEGLALRNNETGVTVMRIVLTKDSSKESRPGGVISAYVNVKEWKVVGIEFSDGTTLSVPVNLEKEEDIRIEEGNPVVDANNKFALDLYSEYKSEEGNIFFSPYSISTALAMTYEGARGQTAEEMQSVFYFPEDDTVRRSGYANLYNEINKEDKKYKLHTANALWPRIDFQLLEEYQNTINTYYGGIVTCLDYAGEAEKSRQTINGWVEDKTEDKIKDLIPSGILDGSTVLVLTNAIYFKGTWITQFDEKDTREEDFTTSSGNTVKIPMMKLTGEDARFNYSETGDLKILELPYEGKELSMLILLPKEGDLDTIEESITTEKISEYRNSLQEIQIDIYIPKFKLETKYFMEGTLAEMGMPTAFGGGADFSGINGQGGIWIDKVIHQAFVEVNEEGTEAAAATAVIMEECARISKVFRADHPFIFIIQQKDSGNILFLGRVSDPTK